MASVKAIQRNALKLILNLLVCSIISLSSGFESIGESPLSDRESNLVEAIRQNVELPFYVDDSSLVKQYDEAVPENLEQLEDDLGGYDKSLASEYDITAIKRQSPSGGSKKMSLRNLNVLNCYFLDSKDRRCKYLLKKLYLPKRFDESEGYHAIQHFGKKRASGVDRFTEGEEKRKKRNSGDSIPESTECREDKDTGTSNGKSSGNKLNCISKDKRRDIPSTKTSLFRKLLWKSEEKASPKVSVVPSKNPNKIEINNTSENAASKSKAQLQYVGINHKNEAKGKSTNEYHQQNFHSTKDDSDKHTSLLRKRAVGDDSFMDSDLADSLNLISELSTNKRPDYSGVDHNVLHFGKRSDGLDYAMMHFGKRFDSLGGGHDVMHFGKRSDDVGFDHDVMHFGKRPDAVGFDHDVMHFGKRPDDVGFDHDVMHFGKRPAAMGPDHNVMHFGKRFGHDVMHFGKRFGHDVMHFGKRFDHDVMHFGKRFPEMNSDHDDLDKRFPSMDQNHNVMHFGKRFPGMEENHGLMHFGKRYPGQEADHNVMHFGKRFPGQEADHNVMHFGKRYPGLESDHNVMHFGKRFPGMEENHGLMHFGKRYPGQEADHNVMHFGKRYPGQEADHNVMHFGKRHPGAESDHNVMHFGKRFPGMDENHNVLHFGKRPAGMEPDHNVLHFGKRSPGMEPDHNVLHFGKRSPGMDQYHNVLHFGKRSYDLYPNPNALHFEKRALTPDQYHNVMHFGKRFPAMVSDHNVLHFGKRSPGMNSYHDVMHFGKRNPGAGFDHNVMHFGKRFEGDSHNVLHFGKRSTSNESERGNNDDVNPENIFQFHKRFSDMGNGHNVMHFGKRFDDSGSYHDVMHFGKRAEDLEQGQTFLHFGKRSPAEEFGHGVMHFGKRSNYSLDSKNSRTSDVLPNSDFQSNSYDYPLGGNDYTEASSEDLEEQPEIEELGPEIENMLNAGLHESIGIDAPNDYDDSSAGQKAILSTIGNIVLNPDNPGQETLDTLKSSASSAVSSAVTDGRNPKAKNDKAGVGYDWPKPHNIKKRDTNFQSDLDENEGFDIDDPPLVTFGKQINPVSTKRRRWNLPFKGPRSIILPNAWLAAHIRRSSFPVRFAPDDSTFPASKFAEKKEIPANLIMHFG